MVKMRDHTRRRPRRQSISWGVVSGPSIQWGWIEDVSSSGILIVARGNARVTHGAVIRTSGSPTLPVRDARVVRIEQRVTQQGVETLVGCRWITGNTRPRAVPEHRRRGDHRPARSRMLNT